MNKKNERGKKRPPLCCALNNPPEKIMGVTRMGRMGRTRKNLDLQPLVIKNQKHGVV